jgi:hypothetical protein
MAQTKFDSLFVRLRAILRKHADRFTVTADSVKCFCLEATPGPATLQAWNGKLRRPMIPVAWVEIEKTYVGFHLMGIYGDRQLLTGMSLRLKAHMHGKTCFSFRALDEPLFQELEQATANGIRSFEEAGFISAKGS